MNFAMALFGIIDYLVIADVDMYDDVYIHLISTYIDKQLAVHSTVGHFHCDLLMFIMI